MLAGESECICSTVRPRHLDSSLVSRKSSYGAISFQEKYHRQTETQQQIQKWDSAGSEQSYVSDEAPSSCLEILGKQLSAEEKVNANMSPVSCKW